VHCCKRSSPLPPGHFEMGVNTNLFNLASPARPLATADETLLGQLGNMGCLTPQQADYARRVGRSLNEPATHVLRLLRLASDADIARALATLCMG